ncbi:MAG: hypothetical protein CMM87_06870 [Rickettsiales bacterium]|nr:hypothetical protein [Rickettsiales bacterium]
MSFSTLRVPDVAVMVLVRHATISVTCWVKFVVRVSVGVGMNDAQQGVIELYNEVRRMFETNYGGNLKNQHNAYEITPSQAHSATTKHDKSSIKQNQPEVLMRWFRAYLLGLSTDAFYAFFHSWYWENYERAVTDKNKNFEIRDSTDADGDIAMQELKAAVPDDSSSAEATDMKDYLETSVKHVVLFYFDNSVNFAAVSAIIAMSKCEHFENENAGEDESKDGNVGSNVDLNARLKRKKVLENRKKFAEKIYAYTPNFTAAEKRDVTVFQKQVYVYVSRLLHLYGFVQSKDYYTNDTINEKTFYDLYLKNNPDVLAYCLMDPVLEMCLVMYRETVLDGALGSLFVLICLVSITDSNNVDSVIRKDSKTLTLLRENVFLQILTNYYKNLYVKSGQMPDSQLNDIEIIASIFVQCYKHFVQNLSEMCVSCLLQNQYFDGVTVRKTEEADNSFESLISQMHEAITRPEALQLRF